jgi:uncharacterized ParB-like nuclease family protein
MFAPLVFDTKAQYRPFFDAARGRARLNWIRALLRGGTGRLLNLSDLKKRAKVVNQRDIGTREIAVDQIKGSEGRSSDFDSDFNPIRANIRERWLSIMEARAQGTELPPIDVIKVGPDYYVRDGHHRVSVARALNAASIDAHITEIQLR